MGETRKMSNISVTRMELLARKAQIILAKQGRDLLEQKRTALLKEFMRMADTTIEYTDVLEVAASNARRSLARAETMAGNEGVRSAALAARTELPLQITSSNLMGVKVPKIVQKSVTRTLIDRGYSVTATSTSIDEAAQAFENEIEAIIELAEMELHLTRMAGEIQRTYRRLNALDHFLIPRLKKERGYIQMALDDRERADHFRMKLVKRMLGRKRTN